MRALAARGRGLSFNKKVLDSVSTGELCLGVFYLYCLTSWPRAVKDKALLFYGSLNPGHLEKIWSVKETFLCAVIIKDALVGDILEMLLSGLH